MDRTAGYKRAFLFILAAFLVTLITASFISYRNASVTGNSIMSESISVTGTNAIMLPDSYQELPNTEEGTMSLWTKPPVQMFEQFDDSRKYIIFFTSTNVPGMRIVYNLDEKVFEAGVPVMKSPRIDIFDDAPHNVVYTFKRGVGQSLFIDGQIVNTSDYIEITVDKVTGFAVLTDDGTFPTVSMSGVSVQKYGRYMTQGKLDVPVKEPSSN